MAEGDSELESGYVGTESTVEKQEVVTPEPEKVPEPQEEAKPDPMQELRDLIAKQNELIEKQGQRLRNAEGHIGGLNHTQKQLQETLAASKAASQKVADAPTQAQVEDAIDSPEEWKALKADFPDWASATEKYMDARMRKLPAVDVDGLQKRVAEQIKGETESVRKEIIESSLDAVFPDWKSDINSPAFAEWRSKQPPEIEALPVTSLLKASANYDTSAVAPGYFAYCHSDLERQIRDLPNFVPAEKYASGTPEPGEIGKCERFRYILSPDLPSFQDAGASGASYTGSGTGYCTTSTTALDVYPIIVLGADAFSQIAVRGLKSLDPTFLPPGEKSKSDPLGQRGYAGTSWWKAVMIENSQWMAVVNVARAA